MRSCFWALKDREALLWLLPMPSIYHVKTGSLTILAGSVPRAASIKN